MATSFGSLGRGGGLTSSVFANANEIQAFAGERVAVVDSFVLQLSNAILDIVPPVIEAEFPVGPPTPAIEIPTPPEFETPVWVAPGFPTAFTGELDIDDLEIAPFDENPPVLNFGTAPAEFSGVMPTAPATNLEFEDPTLEVSLPDVPTLLELNVREFDGINLPDFDEGEMPVLTAVAPTLREYVPGAQYTSSLLTTLQNKLQESLTTGTTGLDPAAEEAMWERGREREARAYADAVAKIDQMEELGYAMPPGWFADARSKLIIETDFAERGHSREVMIKQAEMSLDFVKVSMTAATQLEGQLIDYSNSVEQRLFESTRYATEAGISIYNAQVQSFSAMVELYRSKIAIYEAQVRAEIAKVDAYRAEIAAEEAKASINRSLVDQYRVQVEAALSSIEIYKAQISGIQTKAEIERTKVLIFGEEVRGYVAQINAYTAGVEGFRASLQAEQTKQEVFKSQVDAFAARVNAVTRQIDGRIEAYKGRIEAKRAEYDGYRAAVEGESARIEGITRRSTVISDAYRAEVQAAGAYNDVLTRQWQAVLDQNQRVSEIAINTAKANSELYVTTRSLALEAAKTSASVSAQLGAAAINAFNVSASVSSSESYNASESLSVSSSTSTSNSVSNNQNYNYSASV